MGHDWIDVSAAAGSALAVAALAVVTLRYRRSTGLARARLLWLVWGVLVTATAGLVGLALNLLVDWPAGPASGLAAGCLVVPAAVALGRSARVALLAEPALVHTLVIAGLVGLVGGVYVLVVIGLGRAPEGDERTILALSMAAAADRVRAGVPRSGAPRGVGQSSASTASATRPRRRCAPSGGACPAPSPSTSSCSSWSRP